MLSMQKFRFPSDCIVNTCWCSKWISWLISIFVKEFDLSRVITQTEYSLFKSQQTLLLAEALSSKMDKTSNVRLDLLCLDRTEYQVWSFAAEMKEWADMEQILQRSRKPNSQSRAQIVCHCTRHSTTRSSNSSRILFLRSFRILPVLDKERRRHGQRSRCWCYRYCTNRFERSWWRLGW